MSTCAFPIGSAASGTLPDAVVLDMMLPKRSGFLVLERIKQQPVPPVVVIFVFGLFWPRAGARAALATLLGGHAISMACFIATLNGWPELHFTLIAGLIFAVSSVIFWLAGRWSAPSSPGQVARFTYRREILARTVPGPWWQDYRAQSVVLLLLTLWLVLAFW